ncbi:MAG TPA: DUF6515 family protein [Steroidobacteraceae bacterium]|nr:DUF6515 family protein [Steroidobacteraceae bacterium]
MRLRGPMLCAMGVFCAVGSMYLAVDCACAQEVSGIAPYHRHRDTHHGQSHVYPDRGAILRELPGPAVAVNYAGIAYRFTNGVWLEQRGPAFIVVDPPIGVVVPSLPAFAATVSSGAQTYLYANDVYYQARPDLGGYEVVNDPTDPAVPAPEPAAAAPAAMAPSAAVSVVPAVATPASAVQAPPPAALPVAAPAVTAAPAAVLPAAPAALPTAPAPVAATPSVATAAPAAGARVFAYPRNGQSAEQQARDHYECYRFAVAQTGFDPLGAANGIPAAQLAQEQSDYDRAQAACFEGRGYALQ